MKKILANGYSLLSILAVNICVIVDFVCTSGFTWSKITTPSIIFAWLVLYPIICYGREELSYSLKMLSIFILPYLLLLSLLINRSIINIGFFIAIISVIYLWCQYNIMKDAKDLKYISLSVSFFITLLLYLIIDIYLCFIFPKELLGVWDFIGILIFLVTAIIFFFKGCTKELFKK